PVRDIDLAAVIAALEPIWNTMPETANRVRSRIESILDYSALHGWRDRNAENPARWSLLGKKFASRRQLKPTQHLAAMPFANVPAFMQRLRLRTEPGAAAIEFCILTAARRNEVLLARWDEIDFEERIWTVPASRMKRAAEHRVPLSDAAMRVLGRQREI